MDQESTTSNSPEVPSSPKTGRAEKQIFPAGLIKSALQRKTESILKPLPDEQRCTLSWKNLAYFIPLTNE